MAISTGSKLKFEYMLGGGPPPIVEAYESSGAAWMPGALLIHGTSGLEAAASGNVTGVGFFALSSGQGATADLLLKTSVILVTDQCVFSACVQDTTAAASLPQPEHISQNFPVFTSAAAGAFPWYIDLSGTTTVMGAYVIGMKDTSADLYGRVYFVFNKIGKGPWFTSFLAT